MAMFKAAASAFMPKASGAASEEEPEPAKKGDDELDALRAQMAAMQKKLDSLGS
jgi:polyhydroxyalkanoate synthesis regulator protein